MKTIINIIICAIVSVSFGCIFGIGMLYSTGAPCWAVTSLITITSLQCFTYLFKAPDKETPTNAE